MTFLPTALAITTILCVLLGWACYRLYIKTEIRAANQNEWRLDLMKENEHTRKYLRGVLNVLEDTVGGLHKQIDENIKIAEAIHLHAPDIFRTYTGLAYSVHAMDQFLVSLYASVADEIYDRHPVRFDPWQRSSRETIFDRIYESAGLPPPPKLQYPTQVRGTTATDSGLEDGLPPGLAKVV